MWTCLSFWQAGVTGFCMGGALAIASSVLVPHVDAVVAFYGVPSSELADPAQAKAPVQAHFGELDNFVGFSDVTVWECLHWSFEILSYLQLDQHSCIFISSFKLQQFTFIPFFLPSFLFFHLIIHPPYQAKHTLRQFQFPDMSCLLKGNVHTFGEGWENSPPCAPRVLPLK